MKGVIKDCVRQDQYLEENQQYCVGTYPQVRSYKEMVGTLATMLLDALVHETEDRMVSFAIGRALALWKKENYLESDLPDAYLRFHNALRKDVVTSMFRQLEMEIPKDGDLR